MDETPLHLQKGDSRQTRLTRHKQSTEEYEGSNGAHKYRGSSPARGNGHYNGDNQQEKMQMQNGNPLLDIFEPSMGKTADKPPYTYDCDFEDPVFGPLPGVAYSSRDVRGMNGMAPAWVEDMLLNPLSAVQVAAANIGPLGGLESLGLGSWLDTMNINRGHDGRLRHNIVAEYENNPLCSVSAIVDTRALHTAIRARCVC
jgi:hypothetical protein